MGRDDAVREDSAARIAKAHDVRAEHVALDPVPELVARTAFRHGDAVEVDTSRAIAVGKAHVVVADGFKHGTPHDELVVVHGHVEKASARFLLFARTARKVGQEHHATATCGHFLRAFRHRAVVGSIVRLLADVVLEPAQGETARADEAPVEVGVGERARIEDEPCARFGELGDDALRRDAEHSAGACHVDALACLEDAGAKHGLHRVACAAQNGNARPEARAFGHCLGKAADFVPGLHDFGHVLPVDAENFELFVGPALFLDVVAQAPAGHGAPVDEGVLALEAREMHENVGGVVHELHAVAIEGLIVLQEPAGEHRGEHRGGNGVARLAAPDLEFSGVEGLDVGCCAAVKIVDVGRHGIAIGVDADDAADDAVAHDGADVLRIPAHFPEGLSTGGH